MGGGGIPSCFKWLSHPKKIYRKEFSLAKSLFEDINGNQLLYKKAPKIAFSKIGE